MAVSIALVRAPGPRLAEGLVTHIERAEVDLAVARSQWGDYVDAMRTSGWVIEEVDCIDECPDAVFIEDAAVVFGDQAVLTRPGATSRVAEVAGLRLPLAECGLDVVELSAGTLDGGDVLKIGSEVWVGVGGRTNAMGVASLVSLVEPYGWTVRPVAVTKVLHLKSAVTALPDGTVIGFPPLVDDPAVFERFRAVEEESGSHVVITGPDRLLMAASAPRTAAMLRAEGYEVDVVDISEFEKLEGCVTCLSIRVRGGGTGSLTK
jgi:dimethylargininase